jgi:hypothetical protein
MTPRNDRTAVAGYQQGLHATPGLWRSQVAPDLCSGEVDFDMIKTVRANAMPCGAAAPRHGAKPPLTLPSPPLLHLSKFDRLGRDSAGG